MKSSDVNRQKIKDLMSKHRKAFKVNAHVDMLQELNAYIEGLVIQNKELREELISWNKDEKLQLLQDKIEDMGRASIYIRTNKETEDEDLLLKGHRFSCDGNISYEFQGNGIGSWYTLECRKCGMKKEISDIENW